MGVTMEIMSAAYWEDAGEWHICRASESRRSPGNNARRISMGSKILESRVWILAQNTYWLCDLRQVTSLVWASFSSSVEQSWWYPPPVAAVRTREEITLFFISWSREVRASPSKLISLTHSTKIHESAWSPSTIRAFFSLRAFAVPSSQAALSLAAHMAGSFSSLILQLIAHHTALFLSFTNFTNIYSHLFIC